MVLVLGIGFGIFLLNDAPNSAKLSAEEAENLVKNQFLGEVMKLELEKSNNGYVYEIEIDGDDGSYELLLDGDTGDILHLEEKESKNNEKTTTEITTDKPKNDDQNQIKDDDNNNDDSKDDNNSHDDSKDNNNNNSDDQDDNSQKEQVHTKTVISLEQAKAIALKEVNGAIEEIELDEDDGNLLYEVEMVNGQGEIELDIDAYTGEILVISFDSLDD
ncbi:putative membrane protein YkoI [Salirhabdus euzebyi]|uniref:Putative membrane protein YkoI n=1 Tax=Salirhabdus euzebyi TaxID=394506 RepID=A0A841Q6L9_9BACI|nr:PepSY domain-containing protein [Salirhabdus euzebyi]MBB6454048.1 putative membrane protein YkoI [Salirhabdus euzebyi]